MAFVTIFIRIGACTDKLTFIEEYLFVNITL